MPGSISQNTTREPVFLVLDFETYSEADLRKCGAEEYSLHPSTEILCTGYVSGSRSVLRERAVKGHLLLDLAPFAQDPRFFFVAHNAGFERAICQNVLGLDVPLSRWICTAALARSHGLPGSLDGAALALGLKHQKDAAGHRLMLQLSKPKKPSKKDPSTRYDDPERLARLIQYCRRDVEVTRELFLTLPPLHPVERKFWFLDQRINARGFQVDRRFVKNALKLIARETRKYDAETAQLTHGELASTRQTAALLKFLAEREGVNVLTLRSQNLHEILAKKLSVRARRLLELRQNGARSSTAKFRAFEIRSRSDGRARDNTIFFGAHTGRQSGTGLQPQNLFKTVFPQADVEVGVDLIRAGDRHAIDALFPSPMDLFASTLRSAIVAAPHHVLDVGDFATIEVRVLFWLAGHAKGLAALAGGDDLYIAMAAYIFNVSAKELTVRHRNGDKDAFQKRQLGKQVVLGAGYGIGVGGQKFQETCARYGIEITLDLASAAVRAYRELHAPIPAFWGVLERGAFLAMDNPGKVYSLRRLSFSSGSRWLYIGLPSGRKLKYFDPRVERDRGLYGDRRVLSYMGTLNPSKKWGRVSTWGGKLAENVVQAVSADLLFEALARLEARRVSRPVLAVHDEIVAERKAGDGSTEEFIHTMSEAPTWAEGLPVKVEGWSETRYRK